MRKTLLFKLAATLTIAALILASCTNSATDPAPAEPQGTLRYDTVPFAGTARSTGNVFDKLIYYAHDDDYNYYVFLLGHVNRVPIAFRQAVIFDGITPITIGYSRTNATLESIMSSLTTAIEHSVTTGYSVGAGGSVAVKGAPFGMGVTATATFSAEFSRQFGTTRSNSNTFETTIQRMVEETDSIEVTIVMHGEPPGLYRYTLFGTTDVFYVLITNRQRTSVVEEYFAVSARGNLAWGVDFEPDLAGNFGRTAMGSLLVFPEMELSDLPEPSLDVQPELIPPQQPAPVPTFNLDSGTLTGPTSVILQSNGGDIHFTMSSNGTPPPDPTASSPLFTGPIFLAQNPDADVLYIIRAFVVMPGMLDSPVVEGRFAMSREALVTDFRTSFRTGLFVQNTSNANEQRRGVLHIGTGNNHSTRSPYREFVTSDFDIERLRDEGYTHFDIILSWHSSRGHRVFVHPNHINENQVVDAGSWLNFNNNRGNTPGWTERTISRLPLDDYNNRFTFSFTGGNFFLGYTMVRVVAQR